MSVSCFPKGSEAALALRERFLSGDLPWDVKPTAARDNDEVWKRIAPKTFANGFNKVRQEAAFIVEDEERERGTKKINWLIAACFVNDIVSFCQ